VLQAHQERIASLKFLTELFAPKRMLKGFEAIVVMAQLF
jgi:hypothetical protein